MAYFLARVVNPGYSADLAKESEWNLEGEKANGTPGATKPMKRASPWKAKGNAMKY